MLEFSIRCFWISVIFSWLLAKLVGSESAFSLTWGKGGQAGVEMCVQSGQAGWLPFVSGCKLPQYQRASDTPLAFELPHCGVYFWSPGTLTSLRDRQPWCLPISLPHSSPLLRQRRKKAWLLAGAPNHVSFCDHRTLRVLFVLCLPPYQCSQCTFANFYCYLVTSLGMRIRKFSLLSDLRSLFDSYILQHLTRNLC